MKKLLPVEPGSHSRDWINRGFVASAKQKGKDPVVFETRLRHIASAKKPRNHPTFWTLIFTELSSVADP
jgi:hypothetical protein